MKNRRKMLLYMCQTAMIAGIYAALTIVLAPISFNFIQVRIAEALCILPLFTNAAVPGLFLGCLIGNFFGGAVLTDVFFGSLATLIGAAGGYILRFNRWLVPLPTVVSNTIIIPFILKYGYEADIPLYMSATCIFIGEMISSYLLGEILCSLLLKQKSLFRKQ